MPECQICHKTYAVINKNHLAKHDLSLEDYIKQYGDPNTGQVVKAGEGKNRVKSLVEKAAKPKQEITYHMAKTIEELWEMEKTIQVPDAFICVMEHNKERLDELLELAYKYKNVALDTETTGLDMHQDFITDVIITIGGDEPTYGYNYFIPTRHVTIDGQFIPGQLSMDYVVEKLKPMLEDPAITKDMYNDYFDEVMLWASCDVTLRGVYDLTWRPNNQKTPENWSGGWDGLIAGKILNENEQSHKMKDIYRKYLHEKEPNPQIKALGVDTFEEQFGKIKFYRVPLKVATCYGAKDGYMTRRIKEFQKPYIDTTGRLREVFYNIEMPLIPVLVDMRKEGISVDAQFAKQLEVELTQEREREHTVIMETLGNINLNSPKQLSKALFDDLGLPDLENGSTKAAVLEELAEMGYAVAESLINYKKKEKLISTYLVGLPEIISKRTGRVHCHFNQLGARTGRFSSSSPNLQNIPAKFKKIRKIFTARPGNILISCDYSLNI